MQQSVHTLTCFLCIFCLFLLKPVEAQLGHQLIYSSSDNGPSHRTITAIIKDQDGLMWFGTWDGLNRFDGITFKTFDELYHGDNHVLESRRINQLLDDRAHTLWILTFNKEVYSFDKHTEKFRALTPLLEESIGKKIKIQRILAITDQYVWLHTETAGVISVNRDNQKITWYHRHAETPHRLNADEVSFLKKDERGKIWIGTSNGIQVLEERGGRYTVRQQASLGSKRAMRQVGTGAWGLAFSSDDNTLSLYGYQTQRVEEVKIGNAPVNNLLFSKFGDYLYITNADGAVYRLDLHTKVAQKLTQHSQSLHTIFEDSKGNLWIELTQGGVFHLNRDFNNTAVFEPLYTERSATVPFFCFEDNGKRVWVNFKGGGFGYYDENSQQFHFTIEEDRKLIELPQYNYRIYYDPTGIAWLCTESEGLIRLVFERKLVKHHFLEHHVDKPIPEDVRSLLLDQENRLFAGTKSGRLFSKQQEQWQEYTLGGKPTEHFDGIYSLLENQDGTLWIGSKSGGLFKAIDKGCNVYDLQQFNAGNSALKGNQIYSLYRDQRDILWVGTFDNGLYQMEQRDDRILFRKFPLAHPRDSTKSFHKIRYLTGDRRGNLWIATTEGVVIKSPEGRLKFIRYNPPEEVYLRNNDIQHIFSDQAGDMWLCTAGGGVTKVTGDPFGSMQMQNFGKDEGLFNGFVLSGGRDGKGSLWFATENGLFKYHMDEHRFAHVNAYTNLRGFYFSEKTMASRDGKLFFGTTKGVAEILPKDYMDTSESPEMVFTKLSINNVEHHLVGTDRKININYIDRLVLPHDRNNLSIDFAITDFRANHFNYSYRLLGIDSIWHQNGDINRATFTNLRPGKYTLEVKNVQDYYMKPSIRRLEILIHPPWWKTWWAYCLYVLVIALLLYAVNRFAQSMWMLKQKVILEKRLAAVKMRFFTNISHELRTPLTLILSPTAQLIKERKLDEHSMGYLQIIDKNAKRMQQFVDQLLDLRKIQENTYNIHKTKVEVVAFVKHVLANFQIFAQEREVKLQQLLPAQNIEVMVDKRSLDSILYNLLSNALKYAPPTTCVTLQMTVDQTHQQIRFSVCDDGPGMPQQDIPKIFELFYSDPAAVADMDKSSGVGLALCKELVDLHGGEINARNRPVGGFEVYFTLPLFSGESEQLIPAIKDERGPLKKEEHFSLMDRQDQQILLVEDNADLRSILYKLFSPKFTVLLAENGAVGLEIAQRELPDIVISDVMMPVLDGITLTHRLKQHGETSHIPIVLLSAKQAIETQIQGLEYGADFYMTKPFDMDVLYMSVQNLVKQRERWFAKILERRDLLLRVDDAVMTNQDTQFLQRVVAIVEEKMTDSELKIDDIAAELHMGRHTFHKKFKSLTNRLPVEFIRDLRLEKAKQLFDQGADNITEVAYKVGFNNPKYFSTCFKDKFEVSPKAYTQKKV